MLSAYSTGEGAVSILNRSYLLVSSILQMKFRMHIFSVSHTHTHTHTHAYTLTHTQSHIHTHSHTLSHTHAQKLTRTHTLSLSHTHTHTHSLTHFLWLCNYFEILVFNILGCKHREFWNEIVQWPTQCTSFKFILCIYLLLPYMFRAFFQPILRGKRTTSAVVPVSWIWCQETWILINTIN
jgi:hypothetical protein